MNRRTPKVRLLFELWWLIAAVGQIQPVGQSAWRTQLVQLLPLAGCVVTDTGKRFASCQAAS